MAPERTPWFKASEHDPARPGIYLVMAGSNRPWWRAFDGEEWYAGISWVASRSPDYEEIMKRKNFDFFKLPKTNRHFEWCGVTEESK